jgi:murein endopeptidase
MKRHASCTIWVILGLVLLTSCSPTTTPIPATATPLPTLTPTPQPLGHPENPLVIGFVVENPQTPEYQSAAQRLSTALTERA